MDQQFLAVGDVTTDTFIRLTDAQVHCAIDTDQCTISMPWGAKIPYEFAIPVSAVGNAANAAISAARLGLRTSFLSATGTDESGVASLATLRENDVATELVTTHKGLPSNHDFVLWFETERTILIKHSAFPYHIPSDTTPPPIVYLSSLGDESGKAHAELIAWLSRFPQTKLVFQPGHELSMPRALTDPIYRAAYISVCNKEEAEGILGVGKTDMTELLKQLRAIGPQVVIITDGPKGAYAFDGTHILSVPLYPDPAPPYERTGAGDAFASAVAAALALGKPLDEALLWGPINSMSVVQKVGAQEGLLHREELEKLLAQAPADYQIHQLS